MLLCCMRMVLQLAPADLPSAAHRRNPLPQPEDMLLSLAGVAMQGLSHATAPAIVVGMMLESCMQGCGLFGWWCEAMQSCGDGGGWEPGHVCWGGEGPRCMRVWLNTFHHPSLPAQLAASHALEHKFTHDRLGTAFCQTTHRALGHAEHAGPQTLCIPGAKATCCPGADGRGAWQCSLHLSVVC